MVISLLVFKEKLKLDPMERERLMVCPMLASVWQNSRHCFTRAELLAPSGEEDISEEVLADGTLQFHIFI